MCAVYTYSWIRHLRKSQPYKTHSVLLVGVQNHSRNFMYVRTYIKFGICLYAYYNCRSSSVERWNQEHKMSLLKAYFASGTRWTEPSAGGTSCIWRKLFQRWWKLKVTPLATKLSKATYIRTMTFRVILLLYWLSVVISPPVLSVCPFCVVQCQWW